MRRRLRPLLVSVWLIFALGGVRVQAERLPIKVYSSADGLGSGFVDFLIGDSRGFMWFCTRDGLSRFDGARFINYRVGDQNSTPGIERITETRGGIYWITTSGGLYRFTASSLSQPSRNPGDRPFLNAQYISNQRGAIFEDHTGTMWYYSGDLFRLREQQSGKFGIENANLGLPSNPKNPLVVFHVREAPDGSLWLSTNQGLVRRLTDGRIILYQHETNIRQSLVGMTIDGDGRIWVVWGEELFVFKPPPLDSATNLPQLSIQPFTPNLQASIAPDREFQLPQKPGDLLRIIRGPFAQTRISQRLFRSRDDHIWFASGNELLEFDGRLFHLYGATQGLPTGMYEMAEDSAGNLWIASQAGLVRLDRRGMTTYTQADGLASPRLFAINESVDGELYFANGDFYLSRFDGKGFQSVRPQIDKGATSLWASRYAFLSRANEWWILTTDHLYRFANGNLQKPLAIYDSHHGLPANEAYQIFEDSHGDIWLSQQTVLAENYGLYRLKRGEKNFYRFSEAENLPRNKSAFSFAEDKNGNLWIGFYEGGIARFANNRFHEFTKSDGLAEGAIIDLHLDRKGRLWVASIREGVRRVDDPSADKPQFTSFTTADGLSSNNVRTITEDNLGNVYVGTARGIDRIASDSRSIKHYSVGDGLASDFVLDSHCDSRGSLWFATTNGLSRLFPTTEEKRPAPPVLLGALRIAGEEQAVPELGETDIRTGDLTSTRNNLQIEYFGLDFQPGETLRYQFMLEGADLAWSGPTEQRTVTYANLKPGSYRFLVRAVNADGLVSVMPATIVFRILPPIWLRWWFLLLASLLTLFLLYSFYRYRMMRLREVNTALAEAKRAEEDLGKAREERLRELARVRTRIATDLHDDIGASLTHIALLSEVARQQSLQGNGAPVEPLSSIVNVSNELVETMSDIVWAINPQKDHLQDLIQRMRRFASDLLISKGITLAFQVPTYEPELPLGANARREVFLIFKESLTNIVKHSGASEVTIRFDFSQDHLTLKVSDNGKGFRMDQVSANVSKGGHGLASIRKRATEMNGSVDIKSDIGRGTMVTFQLPLDSAARHRDESPTQMGGDRLGNAGLN